FDAKSGAVLKEFVSVPLTKEKATPRVLAVTARPAVNSSTNTSSGESLPDGAEVVSLEVQPAAIKLSSPNEYAQILVTAKLASGDSVDGTRMVLCAARPPVAQIFPRGVVEPIKDGTGRLFIFLGKRTVEAPVEVSGMSKG